MTEQISHKKSLRIERLREDRRKLLEEYSQVEEAKTAGNGVEQSAATPLQNEDESVTETGQQQEQEQGQPVLSLEERPISELSIKEVVQVHNKLVGKEIEVNNSIKGTIYDNYYDLIRVNELLKKLIVDTEGNGKSVKQTGESDETEQQLKQQHQQERQEGQEEGSIGSRRGKVELGGTDNIHLLMQKLSTLREDLGLPR